MIFRVQMLGLPGYAVVGEKIPLSVFWDGEKGDATVIEVKPCGDYVIEYDVNHNKPVVYNSIVVYSEK